MGLKEIQIMFDNPWATYYAGHTVSGQMILKLDSPKKVRSVSIKFKGEANVSWSEQESRTNSEGKSESETIWYTSHEKYFENKFLLLGGHGDSIEIPPGTHTYNFSTMLPPTLPSSFEGEHGHVRYTVKVTLDRPWKFDQDCKVAFTVISPLDLNHVQEARLPIRKHDEKFVGMCCCESGPLSITLDVPFSGFVSGQYIPVAIEIENMTTRNVTSSRLTLRKKVVFRATRPSQKTRESRVTITDIKLGVLGAHSSNRYTENLLVPALPPSNLYNCSIIDVNYDFKVETDVSGFCARGLTLKSPIIFGTTPLQEAIALAQPFPPAVQIAEEKLVGPPMVPSVGWTTPGAATNPSASGAAINPSPPGAFNLPAYPDLPPPSYEQCIYSKANNNIRDEEDSEHTQGMDVNWAPRYPTYNFNPSAPLLS